MVWTKEHFEEVAKIINKFDVCKEGLTREFSRLFESKNPNFNEDKFREAVN